MVGVWIAPVTAQVMMTLSVTAMDLSPQGYSGADITRSAALVGGERHQTAVPPLLTVDKLLSRKLGAAFALDLSEHRAGPIDAPLHLLALERQGRDERDSFKTFLFIRSKPAITDLGAPENVQGQANSSIKDGCAAYGSNGNSSDDKKLPSLTDLSLGICMRF